MVLGTLHSLSLVLLYFLLHRVVFVNVLLNDALQVLGVIEDGANGLQRVLDVVEQFFALAARLGLNTAYAGGYAAL